MKNSPTDEYRVPASHLDADSRRLDRYWGLGLVWLALVITALFAGLAIQRAVHRAAESPSLVPTLNAEILLTSTGEFLLCSLVAMASLLLLINLWPLKQRLGPLLLNLSLRNWIVLLAIAQSVLMIYVWLRTPSLLEAFGASERAGDLSPVFLSLTGAIISTLVLLEVAIWARWKILPQATPQPMHESAQTDRPAHPGQGIAPGEKGPKARAVQQAGMPTAQQLHYQLARPALFLFVFAIDLSLAFIPLHMSNLPQAFAGMPAEILMGLPISVEFLAVGIAILWAGVWVDRQGWRPAFYLGIALAVAGSLYSWLASDAVNFILSRGVIGLGFGLVQLSAHGYILSATNTSNKAQGLSHLAAGIYAGSLCGAAGGALLAEFIGYTPVFFISALLVLTAGLFTKLYLSKGSDNTRPLHAQAASTERPSLTSSLRLFFTDYQVLALTVLSSIPAAMTVIGLVNYFIPVYLHRGGIPEAGIGQVLMLFGLCIALFAPRIGKLIDEYPNHLAWVSGGGCLGALSCMTFFIFDGMPAAIIAIILLGAANAAVLSAQNMLLLELPITQALGATTAIAIFRALSRIGQVLGPLVFGSLIVMTDLETGVGYFGLVYLLILLCFSVLMSAVPRSHGRHVRY